MDGSERKGTSVQEKRLEIHGSFTKDLAEDSMFPFKVTDSRSVKVSFVLGDNEVLIEK